MRDSWSILLYGSRKGKWSIVRRRDDDPAAAGGGSPSPDPIPAADPASAEPVADNPAANPAPPNPDDAMWGDLTPDPALEPAANPAEIPEEYTRALAISDYVKEPAHLERAVQAAQEMWDVQTGKVPATTLLEGLRTSNPQMYEKVILEQMVPYIEQVTGKKLGAAAPDQDRPMTVAEYEQRMQQDQQRAQQQRQQEDDQRQEALVRTQAENAGGKHLETLIEAGNGIFEGDVQAAIGAVFAQYAKLGLDPSKVMKEVLSGDMKNLEKAYKAAEKAETLRVKAYSDRIRAKFTKLKNTVPKTGGSQAETPVAGSPDMSTQSGRAKWMAAEFAAGRGGEA